MLPRVAIIGTGIAGMSCALRLQGRAELTLYEREPRVGGHTHTVTVEEAGRAVPIDTGFMVYNEVTYPRLTRLFAELGVTTQPTDMSFGVCHVGDGIEYCGTGLGGVFAQRRNLLSPGFWGMLRAIVRFNREAEALLRDLQAGDPSLREFLDQHRFGRRLREHYLLPMTGAIWSTATDRMLAFPARTLFRFMHNHGLLGVSTHHPWRTVTGGSRSYRDRIIAGYADRIQTACPAVAVRVEAGEAVVRDGGGAVRHFDHAVLATHADEALALLTQPSHEQSRLLGAFRYNRNPVLLHTDASVMPRRRAAWASWNYRYEPRDGALRASTHYWMNRLQNLGTRRDYFVTLDDPGRVRAETVLWSGVYTHPQFDHAAVAAQVELPRLNQAGPLRFCGSYFRYGFHEDALMAGEAAADSILHPRDGFLAL